MTAGAVAPLVVRPFARPAFAKLFVFFAARGNNKQGYGYAPHGKEPEKRPIHFMYRAYQNKTAPGYNAGGRVC